VLVRDPDGRVLAVERHGGGLGLPGGKGEPGEEPAVTAARELLEETGLRAIELRLLHEASPEGKYWCCAYEARWDGEPRASDEGALRWVSPAELASTPPFAAFNAAVLRAAGVVLLSVGRKTPPAGVGVE
jgi:8-oxo-dGTP pyrophosphatase MutT (NUDIX family)